MTIFRQTSISRNHYIAI